MLLSYMRFVKQLEFHSKISFNCLVQKWVDAINKSDTSALITLIKPDDPPVIQ